MMAAMPVGGTLDQSQTLYGNFGNGPVDDSLLYAAYAGAPTDWNASAPAASDFGYRMVSELGRAGWWNSNGQEGDTSAFGTTIYIVPDGNPLQWSRFTWTAGVNQLKAATSYGTNVNTPLQTFLNANQIAEPAGGLIAPGGSNGSRDAHVAVLDFDNNTGFFMWRAHYVSNRRMEVCFACSQLDNWLLDGRGDANWKARACGLPVPGGIVTGEDITKLRAGEPLDHAVAFIVNGAHSQFVSPATDTDGATTNNERFLEGGWVVYRGPVDAATYPDPFTRAYMQTMRDYGAICADQGGGMGWMGEDPNTASTTATSTERANVQTAMTATVAANWRRVDYAAAAAAEPGGPPPGGGGGAVTYTSMGSYTSAGTTTHNSTSINFTGKPVVVFIGLGEGASTVTSVSVAGNTIATPSVDSADNAASSNSRSFVYAYVPSDPTMAYSGTVNVTTDIAENVGVWVLEIGDGTDIWSDVGDLIVDTATFESTFLTDIDANLTPGTNGRMFAVVSGRPTPVSFSPNGSEVEIGEVTVDGASYDSQMALITAPSSGTGSQAIGFNASVATDAGAAFIGIAAGTPAPAGGGTPHRPQGKRIVTILRRG